MEELCSWEVKTKLVHKNDIWLFDPIGSSEQNPSHTYTTPGIYHVALQAYNSGGLNSTRKIGYITVNELPPVANFTGTPTTGTVPLTVTFTDGSTGVITEYAWDFGDTTTSAEQSPSHQYTKVGTYTVNLTVTGPGGSNISSQSHYVTVNELPPVAGFNTDPTPATGIVPLTVVFTDTSTGAITGYTWDFGDTVTSSEQSPSHQYNKAGIYNVTLMVTGPGGSNSKTQTIMVNEAPPIADAQSITTEEDTVKVITLTGSDFENDPLTFMVVGSPMHGILPVLHRI